MSQFSFAGRFTPRRMAFCGLAVAVAIAVAVAMASPSAHAVPTARAASACAAHTTVQTDKGPVCGLVVNGDREWLGIPFAAPPVGALRWQPPHSAAPWTTTRQATAYAPECAQQVSFGTVLPLQGSEDCLYLNVFEPPGGKHASLPVMVHIHGGGFRIGSGQGDYTLLANTGHEVVVSVQYRLGIFGFLAESALGSHSGDYGLQDQQAALKWVRQNIRSFGGDPDNVTIFGESAGGSSVCDQIASPTAAGLFQKGISTSGEYDGLFGVPGPGETLEVQDCKSALPTQSQAASLGARFAAGLGCTGSPAEVASCLRGASATDVAQTAGFGGYQYGGLGTIAPTINGSTLKMTLRQALATGAANRVSVIAGTDRDEDLVSNETGVALPHSPSEYRSLVFAQYGRFAQRVLRLYPLRRFYSPYVAFRTVAADSDTVCPAIVTDQALAHWMPVHGYIINDGDPPPNNQTVPSGSAHVAAWNLTPVTTNFDANAHVLQTQELEYSTTFARKGDPTARFTPVWPELNTSAQEMALSPGADSQAMPVAEIQREHNCAFWDKIAPKP